MGDKLQRAFSAFAGGIGMKHKKKLIKLYQRTINNIDDYLEYSYKVYSTEEVREKVLKELDHLAIRIAYIYSEESKK